MKKNSTRSTQSMETVTINRHQRESSPKKEVLFALRQFARSYYPIKDMMLPGIVLN